MSIAGRERSKITFLTVIMSLGIIVLLWSLLFVTDYIMFKKNMPTIFSKTTVKDATDNRHEIYEQGLFYYVVTENNNREMYLFNKKIK